MTVQSFGARKQRRYKSQALAGVLLASTALVATPQVKAAGEILDPSRPDLHWRYVGIPALSADGTIFVGNVHDTLNNLHTAYHDPGGHGVVSASGFGGSTAAYGMSGDGRYVVGLSETPGGQDRAFRWDTQLGMMLDLGVLDVGNPQGQAWAADISGDGQTVVGGYFVPGNVRAFAWIEGATTGEAGNEQMFQLNSLAGATNWSTRALSDNGLYATGTSNGMVNGNIISTHAVRWNLTGLAAGGPGSDTIISLGSLTGLDNGYSESHDISADGRIVVGGASDENSTLKAFRWVEGSTTGDADNVQMHSLGSLGNNALNMSEALAVSRDGQFVVGWSQTDLLPSLAFRWSEATGMESMHDWLDRNGVSVGGLTLIDATAVSDDGLVIAGLMAVPGEGERAYIARVAAGPGPDPGSGIMDVAEYNRSLFAAAGGVAGAGEFLTWLPMNGAHHRPLMLAPDVEGEMCAWATGDFAVHGSSSTGLGLAEIGACTDLAGGSVRIGGAVGTSRSWQDLALGGSSRIAGQYVLGEVDWNPDGTPLLLSMTGMLGGWQANVDRAYSNGGATALSSGSTQAMGGVVRLRADWLELASLGNTTISPWTSVALGALHVGGYGETGGPFPATFDAQNLTHVDVRLGLVATTELSAQTTLSTTFEVAHRSGTAPRASGQVQGLFDFTLGGGAQNATWVRAGIEVDHKISDNAGLSASIHAASNGRDPSLSGSVGAKFAF
jgi:probable HAF family extracellular repeat protein